MARYVIRDRETQSILSKHRTRQGALDAWRTGIPVGTQVEIVRTYADGRSVVIVEGRWLHPEPE